MRQVTFCRSVLLLFFLYSSPSCSIFWEGKQGLSIRVCTHRDESGGTKQAGFWSCEQPKYKHTPVLTVLPWHIQRDRVAAQLLLCCVSVVWFSCSHCCTVTSAATISGDKINQDPSYTPKPVPGMFQYIYEAYLVLITMFPPTKGHSYRRVFSPKFSTFFSRNFSIFHMFLFFFSKYWNVNELDCFGSGEIHE